MKDIDKLVKDIVSIGFKNVTDDRLIRMEDAFHKENCTCYFFEKEESGMKNCLILRVNGKFITFNGRISKKVNSFNYGFSYDMTALVGYVHYDLVKRLQEMMESATNSMKESKTNPYSGVSFEYNGHTWGMCARDNGVEILVDGKVRTSVFEEPKLTDEALEKEVEKYCKDKGIVYEEDLNMLDFARHFAELSKHTGESAVNSQPKIEPKFKIGDKIRNKKLAVEDTIIDVKKDRYIFRKCALLMGFQDDWELVEEYVNFFNIEETIDEFFDQMQKFGEGKATLNWRETHLHISPEFLRHFANHVATRQKQQMMKNVILETVVMRDSDGDGVETPVESWLTLANTEIPELPENLGLKEGDKVKVIIIKED